MPVSKNSMRLNRYCKWMANVSSCRRWPNWGSTNSIGLDRHHRNCPSQQRIVSIWRTYLSLADKRKHRSWSNLASLHLERQTIPHVQIARRNFEEPAKYIVLNISITNARVGVGGQLKCPPEYITNVSASKNTHFSNCVSRQQWSFVNVMPNSGLANNAKLAASFESNTLTSCTMLNTDLSFSAMDGDTPGVMSTAVWCTVFTRFNVCATTKAPNAYESFVASVTHANSEISKIKCLLNYWVYRNAMGGWA